KPGWKASGTVEIAVQASAQQGALPVQFAVTLEAQKPKAAAGEGAPAPANVTVTAKVTGAHIGLTGVPKEVDERFSKMKGARVEYQVAPDGSGTGYRYELPTGADETRDQLRVLSDVLALVTLPVPPQPLG